MKGVAALLARAAAVAHHERRLDDERAIIRALAALLSTEPQDAERLEGTRLGLGPS
jgi:hypothetical protein